MISLVCFTNEVVEGQAREAGCATSELVAPWPDLAFFKAVSLGYRGSSP